MSLHLLLALATAATTIARQDISVDVTDAGTGNVSIEITANVTAEAADTALEFMLPSLPILDTKVDGQSVTPSFNMPQRGALSLPLAMSGVATHEVVVSMSGAPTCAVASGRTECAVSASLTFLPIADNQNVWYLWPASITPTFFEQHLTLKVPTGQRAVASQGKIGVVHPNGDGSDTITFDFPYQNSDYAFAAGDLDQVLSSDGKVEGLYARGDMVARAAIQVIVDNGARLFPQMAQFNGPVNVERYSFVFVPPSFAYGGESMGGMAFISSVLDVAHYSYILPEAPHEMGHTWWGNLVHPDTGFGGEAFAEYSLWRARGLADGAAAGASGRCMNAVWYMYTRPSDADAAILAGGIDSSPVYVWVTYHKGSQVVRTLEEQVGTEPFTQALQSLTRGARNISVDDFLAAVSQASGQDLTHFKQSWMMKPGYPKPTLSTSFDGQQLTVSSSMIDDFILPLPVVVTYANGEVVKGRLDAKQGDASWSTPLSRAPALVQIDPEWTSARELHPAVDGDVTFDGTLDGADLIEVALHVGGALPSERRLDGHYDPLYDVNGDRKIDATDLTALVTKAAAP
jgi:hypothetical protein